MPLHVIELVCESEGVQVARLGIQRCSFALRVDWHERC